MRFLTLGLLLPIGVTLAFSHLHQRTVNVDTYIATEGPIAKAGVLANIGSDGSKCAGAKSGVVIASPSVSLFPRFLHSSFGTEL